MSRASKGNAEVCSKCRFLKGSHTGNRTVVVRSSSSGGGYDHPSRHARIGCRRSVDHCWASVLARVALRTRARLAYLLAKSGRFGRATPRHVVIPRRSHARAHRVACARASRDLKHRGLWLRRPSYADCAGTCHGRPPGRGARSPWCPGKGAGLP